MNGSGFQPKPTVSKSKPSSGLQAPQGSQPIKQPVKKVDPMHKKPRKLGRG
jgi:hypothetical protein